MRYDRFVNSPVGNVVPITGFDARFNEHYSEFAFVPAPLPATLDLAPATWRATSGAMLALGRLDQASRQIPNPLLLRRPTLRREAQSTSALEGTFAPLVDVLQADDDTTLASSPELAEVLNYVKAAELAFDAVTDGRPVTPLLLFDLHKILVSGTKAEGPDAGRVRSSQVAVGAAEGRLKEARFIPSPPGIELETSLRDWADWIERMSADPNDAVPATAMAHYQFETLHPFNDGNGRLGRLVIVLQLLRAGVLTEPLLTVSPWFEARRIEYQDNLLRVSMTGDWDAWVQFFAQGIQAQAESTATKVSELLAYRDRVRTEARTAGMKGLAIDMLDELFTWPVVTAASVARRRNVTPQAVNTAINKLVNLGIMREQTGRNYNRVFAATEVVNILMR